ncbi:MAG: LysR family transcriptional regulator [Rhodobacteraceae bacterium]|nr:LysR family transcriptional regulator [Paracoccaceae bacterium]
MKRPRLNVLRTFEAAGRHLSFSKAAVDLNITQAAVSQQIRQLESYLGARLFLRLHRRLSLTSTGAAYLDGVHEALDRLNTITDQLFSDRPHQVVVVRCTSSVALLWLSPQIRAFKAKHPYIDLQIRTLDTNADASQLHIADIEIFVSGKADHDQFTKPLLTSVITPVASSNSLDQKHLSIPQDILGLDVIHILGYEDDWHRWFQTFGLDTAQIPSGMTADSSLFAIDAALRGEGVFLGRRPFIDAYLQSGELVEVFKRPLNLHASYFMRQHGGSTNNRNINIVSDWLLEIAATE